MMSWAIFFQIDLPVFLAGALASVACGLIGCFLVLRRMALMGDAISHAVLPGIVIAFIVTQTMHGPQMFIGCAVIGVLTALLTELIHRYGRVESNASMGIVFTVLFAVGVILIERYAGRHVHIDADVVLYGAMETVYWPTAPDHPWGLFNTEVWRGFPPQLITLSLALALNVTFISVLFKELRITTFDPQLAAALGFRPRLMHYLLMTMVAITTVAAFESVGSILVVAMLIVPAVIASLLTDRLQVMMIVAAAAAIVAAAGGYVVAATASLNAAGTIGLALGAVLLGVGTFAPKRGWLATFLQRRRLTLLICREDILGALYRIEEREATSDMTRPDHVTPGMTVQAISDIIGRSRQLVRQAAGQLLRRGWLTRKNGDLALTDRGRRRAVGIVRSHRLWESYLVRYANVRPDHVHDSAEVLEHITDEELQERLAQRTDTPRTDPHGRTIPHS